MSVVVVATIVPLPEHRNEVIATITETVAKVHEEDGCELYALHQADDRLVMVEKWASADALRAHSRGAALAAQAPRLAGKLAGPAEVIVLRAVGRGPGQGTAVMAASRSSRARRGASARPRWRRWPRTAGGWSRSTGAPTTRRCRIALGTRAELDRGGRGGRRSTRSRSRPTSGTRTALAAAVRLAEERWGGLDAAVAAAGVIAGGVPAWQVPAGQEQAVLDVDLGGVLNLARVAVPALLRRPEPRRGPLPGRRLGRGHPRPADARRLLRREGRGGRVRPRAGRRTRRHRRHRERGQPGLDRRRRSWTRAPGSTACPRPAPSRPSSRWAGWCPRPRWPRSSRSWPGTAPAP